MRALSARPIADCCQVTGAGMRHAAVTHSGLSALVGQGVGDGSLCSVSWQLAV